MLNAFRERRPWAAGLVTFIHPVLGMAYLGMGWLAVVYLVLIIGTGMTMLLFLPAGIGGFLGETPYSLIGLAFRIFGTAHAVILTRREDWAFQQKWFSHWYAIVAFAVSPLVLALFLRTFVFQLFNMPSGSMIPNVVPGDYFVALKGAYRDVGPQRGDSRSRCAGLRVSAVLESC